ncbi:hypothetical protein [Aeromicrobium sp.]|uniref:hypothetical protein n=1 Tax=Aeromicrobium sp. TaxID=1871063 RepID=UPI003C32F39D
MRQLVAAGALLVVAACASPEPGAYDDPTAPASTVPASTAPARTGPEAAVEQLMRALDAGNCRRAKQLVVTPSELECDTVEQAAGSFADEGIDLDEADYRAGPTHDASATVRIMWGAGQPTESYDVQRIGGRWRVVFDSVA